MITQRAQTAALAGVLSLLALCAGADVWDIQTLSDDTVDSYNQLLYSTAQVHDLAVRPGPLPDTDWYLFNGYPYRSYEVAVDDVSSDMELRIERLDPTGTTVLDWTTTAQRLSWMFESGWQRSRIRISSLSPTCGTVCGPDDVYTIRGRDTTISLPRWNASGGQVTVLQIQNVSDGPVSVNVTFWRANGQVLHTERIPVLLERNLLLLNAASIPALLGQSGHVTIAHTAGYGGLNVKAVALEPSTGFTFDAQGTYLPH